MRYSSIDIGSEFIRLGIDANYKLTHLQTQKLVYIANGYSLALLDEPIFDDDTTAWKYGPVNKVLYNNLYHHKNNLIYSVSLDTKPIKDYNIQTLIRAIHKKYGCMSGCMLSSLLRQPNTPWHSTWKYNPFGIIPVDTIRHYYKNSCVH